MYEAGLGGETLESKQLLAPAPLLAPDLNEPVVRRHFWDYWKNVTLDGAVEDIRKLLCARSVLESTLICEMLG